MDSIASIITQEADSNNSTSNVNGEDEISGQLKTLSLTASEESVTLTIAELSVPSINVSAIKLDNHPLCTQLCKLKSVISMNVSRLRGRTVILKLSYIVSILPVTILMSIWHSVVYVRNMCAKNVTKSQ